MDKIIWVDKKERTILCTNCEGSGKMLDTFVLEYSMGTRKELKPCWVCEGTGTLKLKVPKVDVECKEKGDKPE